MRVPVARESHALSSSICKEALRALSWEIWRIKFLRFQISSNFPFYRFNLRRHYMALYSAPWAQKYAVEIFSNSTSGLEL